MTISDPKKFCASARSQTPASRYPGEHHTARLPRHLIAVTLCNYISTKRDLVVNVVNVIKYLFKDVRNDTLQMKLMTRSHEIS